MTALKENIYFFYKLTTYYSRLMFVSADMFIASAFSFSVVCHGPTYLLYTWDCTITAGFYMLHQQCQLLNVTSTLSVNKC